ncbi:protein-glutamate O-methyltransferase CheR [Bosea sp. (in: a-proteobacteria)]|uniref:CheR family methyltransferase n=1 Tax=Bosea sp. (in: a-proteobacteria) TaxID=1871050 RepID=UPI002606602A|nr:protein-glutamate O-methyltransferase CheR [Bosea sp. (in: a-proteobacteria)]MCO5091570.1 protein-glutamate O-methyltransferase CheR [Bosea sp. (in: a-proteobacteria)]
MTETDFAFLRLLLQQRSGLSLTADKRYLVESRLGILCRRHGLADIGTLVHRLRAAPDPDLEGAVVDAMTTNETLFFRDQTPFTLFQDVVLPERLAANAASRSLRIWCAAVSSGQEAYSLAMLVDEMAERLAGWKIDILGTDISAEILEKARAGLYSQHEIQRGLPIRMLLKHFRQEGDRWQLSQRIRAMVTFRQHNLLERNDQFGRFDVIFCRNVLIYFDLQTKMKVLERLSPRLVPDGAFILGATETVLGLTSMLTADPRHRGLYRHVSMAAAAEAGRGENAPPLRA